MWLSFYFNVGLILGMLVALVLLFFPQKHKSGNWLLGVSILSLWFGLFMTELYHSGHILDLPHFSRMGNFFVFLVTPSFYFFVRFIFYRDRLFRRWDWIAFIPAAIYLVDYAPYYALDGTQKIELILEQQMGTNNFIFAEGWFAPAWFHFFTRQFWSLIFLFLSVKVVWDNRSLFNEGVSKNNRKIIIMILALALMYAISFFPGFSKLIDGSTWYNLDIQGLTASTTLIALGLFLLFNPSYLYGFFWENEVGSSKAATSTPAGDQNIEAYLETYESLESYVREHKPYLNGGYSIQQLSSDTGIPVYKISPAINSCFKANFNQWINAHRIAEFESLSKNGEYQNLTIDALASRCGFANKASFNATFKRINGCTPREFLRREIQAN